MTPRIAVFAYGSLVDPNSAAQTLGREPGELMPARLPGWRRRWTTARDNLLSEKAFAIEPGGELPPWVLGLNIEPVSATPSAGAPNGALIGVEETELALLDRREIRYDRVEVTDSIEAGAFERVFAYTAKPGHLARRPPPGAVILAAYLRAVESGFAALGPAELDAFRDSTGEPPAAPVEATLVRSRIPPGNPRDW